MSLGISQETALTAVAIAAAVIGFGVSQWTKSSSAPAPAGAENEGKGPSEKKGKKKKNTTKTVAQTETPIAATPAEANIPGQFDSAAAESLLSASVASSLGSKKPKKKKTKAKAANSAADTTPLAEPTAGSADAQYESSVDDTRPATSVPSAQTAKAKGKSKRQQKKPQSAASPPEPATATTAVAASPEATPTPPPQSVTSFSNDTDDGSESWTRIESRRRVDSTTSVFTSGSGSGSPVEERVEDPALSGITPLKPRQGELPLKGFTWGDYEDTQEGEQGEDDESGWDVVKSRGRPKLTTSNTGTGGTVKASSSSASSSSGPPSKRQRQNVSKRESQKAAKAAAEAERLTRLAKYRQDQEKEKIREAYSVGKKTPGGGMSANVDGGKLVWE